MGWTIYYSVKAKSGRPAAELDASFNACCARLELSRGCAPLELRVHGDELRGFTKVQNAASPKEDFVTIVRALQQLAADHPEVTVLVSDDIYVDTPTDVLTVGSPREILKPKPSSHMTAVPVPKTSTSPPEALALQFLNSAKVREKIEAGATFPTADLVRRFTLLGEMANEGKRPRKGTIFDILDTSPCIEEVYASDGELDSLWQRAVEGTLE